MTVIKILPHLLHLPLSFFFSLFWFSFRSILKQPPDITQFHSILHQNMMDVINTS